MNEQVSTTAKALAYAVAFLGALLIVGVMVLLLQSYSQAPAIAAGRAAERAKAMAELRAAEKEALTTVAWLDKGKGIVRLRIDDALRLTEQAWGQNPAAARSNLLARVQKATALPPKAPEKPSAFE